jgi:hypothetical protein
VLEGEEIVSKEGGLIRSKVLTLPISRYIFGVKQVFLEPNDVDGILPTEEGEFFGHSYHHMNPPTLAGILLLALKDMDWSEWNKTVIIGDQAVKEWLEKNAMKGLYRPAMHALSKLELEPTV